jgi:hypothetical protein
MSDSILEQLDFAPSCDGANCPYEIKYQGDYPCCDKMVVVCDLHRTAYSFVEKLSKRLSEGDRTSAVYCFGCHQATVDFEITWIEI